MFVIAEDFVCRPRIEIRQGRATPADFQDFGSEAASGLAAPDPLQALFRRPMDRGRDGFSGEQGEFAYRFFRRRILDVEWHEGTFTEFLRL